MKITYADGIRLGFEYLLKNYSNVFAIGQGVWSPWYVGASMKDLDKNFGHGRVIDTPVSENAVTGLGFDKFSFNAVTLSSTYPKEIYPIALIFCSTLVRTTPVLV